jgi:hypothetical protein
MGRSGACPSQSAYFFWCFKWDVFSGKIVMADNYSNIKILYTFMAPILVTMKVSFTANSRVKIAFKKGCAVAISCMG